MVPQDEQQASRESKKRTKRENKCIIFYDISFKSLELSLQSTGTVTSNSFFELILRNLIATQRQCFVGH